MMHEAIEAIEKAGKPVTVLAPTAEAAHGVLAEQEGFNAETLARFLADERSHVDAKDGLIWINEAALVGTKDMVAIARITEQQNSRIILGGDARQHQPVSRGPPFYLLENQDGIAPLEVYTDDKQALMQAVYHHRLARNASDLVEAATGSPLAGKNGLHQRATPIGLRASQFGQYSSQTNQRTQNSSIHGLSRRRASLPKLGLDRKHAVLSTWHMPGLPKPQSHSTWRLLFTMTATSRMP
jgi:ATP-dependent exoDNAse (exonuclease V) alpha subunit